MPSHRIPQTLLLCALPAAALVPAASAQADPASDCARFAAVEAWQGWISLQGHADGPAWFGHGTLAEQETLDIHAIQLDGPAAATPCPANAQFEAKVQAGQVVAEGRFMGDAILYGGGIQAHAYHFSGGNPLGYLETPRLELSYATGTYRLPLKIAAKGTLVHTGYPNISETSAAAYFFGPYDPLAGGVVPLIDDIALPATGLALSGSLNRSAASQFSLITADQVPVNYTLHWSLAPKEDCAECSEQSDAGEAVVSAESQSLGQAVSLAGLPFDLHYQSERAEGRALASQIARRHSEHLGGWTLGAHHAYDPTLNTLFLGDGQRRDSDTLGKVRRGADGHYWIAASGGGAVYEFDGEGRHLRTRHALTGATLYSFAYDAGDRLATIVDGDGNLVKIERAADGHPTTLIGPYGQRTGLAVDANGHLSSVTSPGGRKVELATDAQGLVTSYAAPGQPAAASSYDARGRLLTAANPVGGAQHLSRTGNRADSTVTRVTAEGRESTYRITRDAAGEQRVATNAAGLATTTARSHDLAQALAAPDGMKIKRTQGDDPRFGRSGGAARSLSVTTPAGLELKASMAQTAALTDPADPFSLTRLTETATFNGLVYTRAYDAASKTLTDKTPMGRKTYTTLDSQGRAIQYRVPGLQAKAMAYDARGRLAGIAIGQGSARRETRFEYGTDGLPSRVVDPLGQALGLVRDDDGRVTQLALPGGTLGYGYDASGNLTALKTPGGAAHQFEYAADGLLTAYTAPKIGQQPNQTRYEYNLDRQPTRIAFPDGAELSFSYDTAGRRSAVQSARGVINYGYNAATGRLESVTAPNSIGLAYRYDGDLLTRVEWTGPVAGRVGYAYDDQFRVKSITVAGNSAVAFTYDKDGLLTQAGGLKLTRDPANGLLMGSALGGVADQWTYSGFGEPASYRATFNGVPLFEVKYTRDRLGRVKSARETLGAESISRDYRYDPAGRLAAVYENGAKLSSYTYDANGNRLKTLRAGVTINGGYDAQDRLLHYGAARYDYSASGQLIGKSADGQATRYEYDTLGNLLGVKLPSGNAIEYLVDGQGRRVGKRVNGVLRQGFLYEARLAPSAELNAAGRVVSRFVYASRANLPDYMIRGGRSYRIVADSLGSPRLVIDSVTGAIAQRLDYDEFGRVVKDTRPGFQPFGFAGGLYDPDTGLVRFGERDYDAETGRWTAKDPLLFAGGSANLYQYASGDPVNRLDSDGLDDAAPSAGNAAPPSAGEMGEQVLVDTSKAVAGELYKKWGKDLVNEGDFKEFKLKNKTSPEKEYEKQLKEADKSRPWVDLFGGKVKDLWNSCINAVAGQGQGDPTQTPEQDPMPSEPQNPSPSSRNIKLKEYQPPR